MTTTPKKKKKDAPRNSTRTLSVQIPADLMEAFSDAHSKVRLSQRNSVELLLRHFVDLSPEEVIKLTLKYPPSD